MNRPKFCNYWSHGLVAHDSDYKDYIDEIEKYCDHLEKVLDNACRIIGELNDCDNIWSEKYSHCPFYEECKTTDDGCIASIEKWKEWLLKEDE